jgi:3-methyladenine DNA glycosylase AlkD
MYLRCSISYFMQTQELIAEIHRLCLAGEDKERAQKFQYYFKHPVDAYGLTSPQVNEIVKTILKGKSLTTETVFEALYYFFNHGKYEEVSCCLLLLDNLHKQFTKATFEAFTAIFEKGIDNWAHADTLAMFVFPKFIKKGIVEPKDFLPWLKASNKFQRRCVPVTFIKAVKQTKEVQPYINFVLPLMSDTEREVHQGMGWFLRECWKIKPQEVEAILLEWKDKAPRLILQYACEKMTMENKQRFKKEK